MKKCYCGKNRKDSLLNMLKGDMFGKANLNIKAEGENEHHKIESIFKVFAKAIKVAVKRDPNKMILPSTKGSL